MRVRVIAVAAVAACVGGCAFSEVSQEQAEPSLSAPIKGGKIVEGYPEVGYITAYVSNGQQEKFGCTATLIAPTTVLTAGHCIIWKSKFDVYFPGFMAPGSSVIPKMVTTSAIACNPPYSEGSSSSGAGPCAPLSEALTRELEDEMISSAVHDVGLIFLPTTFALPAGFAYPTLTPEPVPNGTSLLNVGRINNGVGDLTPRHLWGASGKVVRGDSIGYPFGYISDEIIESGDSGGPDFIVGTHTIAAVNSGAATASELLARVDLVYDWIMSQIATQGGAVETPAEPTKAESGPAKIVPPVKSTPQRPARWPVNAR